MTQNGVVTKLIDRRTAEVSVERQTACGGNCGSCETCMYSSRILVSAANSVFAKPGDRVVIEGRTAQVMGATLLIYMLPLVFLFAAYAAAALLGAQSGVCMWVSLGGLLLGILITTFIGRRKKEIPFEITAYQS